MTALPIDNIKFKFVDEVKKLKGRTNSRLNILFKEEYDVLLSELFQLLFEKQLQLLLVLIKVINDAIAQNSAKTIPAAVKIIIDYAIERRS
ncbi:unnamed protein product [Acanthoscelides obtectus]|uniref:Uncharacterized protein n=1 Tax=Acanthoscelides obtectus TaxID=200917 RepID=A0A9P0PSQ0_ACAOB|nr:unnamed protein product [Acanthoscelides obtectus]CAK1634927.1 hypothetical protein AOBTE_LOCUS8963 [Acanthoscelides obtectus]